MKRFQIIIISIIAAAAALALYVWLQYEAFLDQPLAVGQDGVLLQVERGSTVRSVIGDLEDLGITQSGWRWRLLTRVQPVTIRAGEYALEEGMKPRGLLELLASGNVVHYRFTIIEGWNWKQLLLALAQDEVLQKEVPELDGESRVLSAIDTNISHPEGWFLPETYQYVRGDSDLDILKRAYEAMAAELAEAWSARADNLPLKSAYELLTLASIIEKESGLDSERGYLCAGWSNAGAWKPIRPSSMA